MQVNQALTFPPLFLFSYTGLLCLQCATDFVNRNGFCESCPGGASFLYALFPMLSACLLLYILVTMLLLCHCCQSKNSVTAKATENRTKLKRVQKYFGQIKILISLLQIIASMPLVLVGVDFSVFFQQMAQAFNLFNLDMLSLTTALGCQVSVRFFSSFIIHMLLPLCCLLAIGLAHTTARVVVPKSNTKKWSHINENVSRVVILLVLLLFPGLSTKIFQMFNCKSFEGIETTSLLVRDYSVHCFGEEHLFFTAVAGVFLGVYIAGIPLTMFLLLWKNKQHLHDTTSSKHRMVKNALGGLYLQCKWWWCVLYFSLLNVF